MDLKPIPTQPINIAYPVQHSGKGAFLTNDTTLESVADDLKILLMTNWGERVIHYDFGANLRALVFNQGPDFAQQVTDSINVAIEKWMPYVSVLSISVLTSASDSSVADNSARVTVYFGVGKTGLSGDITVNIK